MFRSLADASEYPSINLSLNSSNPMTTLELPVGLVKINPRSVLVSSVVFPLPISTMASVISILVVFTCVTSPVKLIFPPTSRLSLMYVFPLT